MPDAYAYDVFLSFSHHDEEWVAEVLLTRLEGAGLRACIDFRDFKVGAPSVREMERAVVESRKTILVLTPAYFESAWATLENVMLQTLDPANDKLRLIPLLKEPCEFPLRLRALTQVSFVPGANEERGWARLLEALGAAKPAVPLQATTRADWHLVHPYPMPPNFTGRVAER
jgi:hypothetical protein